MKNESKTGCRGEQREMKEGNRGVKRGKVVAIFVYHLRIKQETCTLNTDINPLLMCK